MAEALEGPVGLGVVGAGAIALRTMAHLALPDVAAAVRLAHVCDPAPGRAEAAAAKYGVARWSTSLESLLDDHAVDAVTICTPIGLHHEHGLAAIRVGKHVHFNKAMALTVAEATELIDEAAAHDVRLVASPGEVLRPAVQRVRELVAGGAIGRVTWARCGFAFARYHEDEAERQGDGPLTNIDPSWYFRTPGGGPLYDMTVYSLHALTTVLGPARRVTALSGTRIPVRELQGREIEVDAHDNSLLLLDFGDNLFAFAYGTAAGRTQKDASYYGTGGEIDGLLLNGQPLEVADTLPHVSGAHEGMLEAHVFEDIMQLVDWARDGTPSPVTAEHARHVIEIIESAYRAAETGETQTLTTTLG